MGDRRLSDSRRCNGQFRDGAGEFFCDAKHGDIPIRCRYRWTKVRSGTPRWDQAFSTDGEKTWEINGIMDFRRPD